MAVEKMIQLASETGEITAKERRAHRKMKREAAAVKRDTRMKAWKEKKQAAEKKKTSQELRMLSSVTINCQVTKIVMNSGSQLSEL